eukprot:739416-Amphidinium_carterae.1
MLLGLVALRGLLGDQLDSSDNHVSDFASGRCNVDTVTPHISGVAAHSHILEPQTSASLMTKHRSLTDPPYLLVPDENTYWHTRVRFAE